VSDTIPYTGSGDHIRDELVKIGLYIQLADLRAQISNGEWASDEKIDKDKAIALANELIGQVDAQALLIEQRLKASFDEGIRMPVERLRASLSLSAFDCDVLFLALAPVIEPAFEEAYGRLGANREQPGLTLNLVFTLIQGSRLEQLPIRERFLPQMPLLRWKLIAFDSLLKNDNRFQLDAPLSIDRHIADYIMGGQFTDPETTAYMEVVDDSVAYDRDLASSDVWQSIQGLADALKKGSTTKSNLVQFYGPSGSGKKAAASVIATTLEAPLLKVDLHAVYMREDWFESVARIIRQALIFDTVLILHTIDFLDSKDASHENFLHHVIKELGENCRLTFFTGTASADFSGVISSGARWLRLAFPVPDYTIRQRIWQYVFDTDQLADPGVRLDELAGKYRFTIGQIKRAAQFAINRAGLIGRSEQAITEEDIVEGCRIVSGERLSKLTRKVETGFAWDDLVLPQDKIDQLKEACIQHRYNAEIFDEWGFSEKIPHGRGQNILFSGVSGTGKTMAVSIIARELKLDLYKINLSSIVSKYIGETEKNLERVFNAAASSNAILLFDEADAIFGKRTEVKDAHDRYANIEVSYLLQKMEEYEGTTILTSNLKHNIDEAFTRRMSAIINFPFPEPPERLRIWRGIFPAKAPIQSDIDYEFLAEKLKVAGGNIKNIALASAFMAISEKQSVGMIHLVKAARREFQKMGKVFVERDFEPYYSLAYSDKEQ